VPRGSTIPRISLQPASLSHRRSFPSCTATSSNVTTLGARGWEGVTNQRLAIVNSTCAVKQLINKRLFTSCARGVLARTQRTQRERIFPPRDDECGADNGRRPLDHPGSLGIKIKKCLSLFGDRSLVINSCPVCESNLGIHGSNRSI